MHGSFRTYHEVAGADRSDLPGQLDAQIERVRSRLASVRRVLAVMSGKGGVGKSLVAVGAAGSLAARADRVGLLDADLASPTAMRMCGVSPQPLEEGDSGIQPLRTAGGMPVMSMGAVLGRDAPLQWEGPAGAAFAWRGAQERTALREMLGDVEWGHLDWLVVDLPPGTDRLHDLADFAGPALSAVAVTIPTEASRASVGRALSMVAERGIAVLGIIENMSGYVCESCGRNGPLLPGAAAEELAAAFSLPILGRVPFDPAVAAAAERGEVDAIGEQTVAGGILAGIADRLRAAGDDA